MTGSKELGLIILWSKEVLNKFVAAVKMMSKSAPKAKVVPTAMTGELSET